MSALVTGTVAPLDALAGITLDDLTATASLQTRVDRKYVLTADALRGPLAALDGRTQVLEIDGLRTFGYESVYFDTPDLASYHLAAHRRRRRFKVRTRTYLDTRSCWLEVKTRGTRGSTVKNRVPHGLDARDRLDRGRWFVDEVLGGECAGPVAAGAAALALAPVLTTRYRRTTLHLPGEHGRAGSRVTIDTDLTWEVPGRRLALPRTVIVETKTGSTASAVDRLLWAHGHRPARISKYATGLAALDPSLPATPWNRTLRRHFVATPLACSVPGSPTTSDAALRGTTPHDRT
ncbi:polyphosphate polymerase domain-containing protein [Cellulomonas sp. 179-A 4D5 NHS]|uniref:polyphosphate polymerase domain-containing protein n=1 Tax=Cellulomonas sp. 179-A 4D5 NHS TaxID=3142378 RepID=UPI0039A28231